MSSELVATYSSLGTKDGDHYYKGPECLACVKDLIRALRKDDDQCGVRRHLGKARVLQSDLIPLLVHFSDDTPLRNDIIRLLVNLTQPICLTFPEANTHKDPATTRCILQVSQYLRQYKEEFTLEPVMSVLGSMLAELCQKEWEDRDDDDIIIIERILLLIRNILHVPADPMEEKRTEDDVSLHDQIIWNLHINGIDELLVFLGSNPNESQWCMHVLEILFLLLREQSPANLAKAGEARSLTERQEDENKIDELMEIERTQQKKSRHLQGARHSKFGGAFTVTNQLTLAGKERVYHRSLAGVNDYSYDIEKRPRRTPKPKRRLVLNNKPRLSTYSIRIALKNFCIQVLEYCFNLLMRVVKDTIRRQHSMDNDETYYLWAMRFFMEFSRLHNFRVDIVSESLQLPTVHQILQLTANSYEHMVMDKRDKPLAIEWGQRLHYSIQAYKELLLHIQEMTQSKDSTILQSSKVILSNLLYHSEYREVFVLLLRNYNEAVLPLTFLEDVVEMTHVYLRLVNLYSKQTGQVVIQKKRKSTKRKKNSHNIEGGGRGGGVLLTEDQLVEVWSGIERQVETLLNDEEGLTGEPPCPFDGASDVPMEEQKEVWPDDVFGAGSMTPLAEMNTLKEIIFNPLSATVVTTEEEEEEGEEEEEQEVMTKSVEQELDINRFTLTFANNKIVLVYSILLSHYKTNSPSLNHSIVKMLHTIAIKHQMMAMLFQISLFRTFSNILDEPPLPKYKELQKFSRLVVSSFFALSRDNSMMYAELLIWKTSGDCYELREGYGALQRKKELEKNKTRWTREQEEQLASLYEQYKNEPDIISCILDALPSEQGRTRRIVASQLVSQGLVTNRRTLHKKKTTNKGSWSEEELFTLQSLWQPPTDGDIKTAIEKLLCYFPSRGIRDVKQQLIQLGLVKGSNRRKQSVMNELDEILPSSPLSPPPTTVKKKKRKKGNLSHILQRIHTNGYTNQLSWLSTYISDEAKDRSLDNEWEELCIVTVDQSVAEALETELFCELMTTLGLTPPTDQEVYWRIPGTMSPLELEEITSTLNSQPLPDSQEEEREGEKEERQGEEEERQEEGEGLINNDTSSDEDEPRLSIVTLLSDNEESMPHAEALKLLKKKRLSSKKEHGAMQEKEEEEEREEERHHKRLRTVSESLDDDDDNSSTRSNEVPRKIKRNVLFDDNSDDDESPAATEKENCNQPTNTNADLHLTKTHANTDTNTDTNTLDLHLTDATDTNTDANTNTFDLYLTDTNTGSNTNTDSNSCRKRRLPFDSDSEED